MFLIGIFWKNCGHRLGNEPPYTPGVYGAKAVMMKDKQFLITGAGGQLARAFISSLEVQGLEYLAPRKDQLDITNPGQVLAVAGRYRPDVLINCAAYNQVDIAQEHPAAAFSVNSDAVGNLAAAANISIFSWCILAVIIFSTGKKAGCIRKRTRLIP